MIEQLKLYILENDLHNRAIKGFWVAFNNWKTNCPDEYEVRFSDILTDKLNVFIHAIGLKSSQWPECDNSHIIITVLIHYEERQLGWYTGYYSLSEDVDDDDFFEVY